MTQHRFKARLLLRFGLLAVYCVMLLLAFDLIRALINMASDRPSRIASERFHHELAPNFDGYVSWGRIQYRHVTNDLGFRDATVRVVPPRTGHRRIVLVGDSFTEALGMSFEESFAGLLFEAGQLRSEKIEFLNLAVASYSPTIYQKRIVHLLDSGFRFDEVVVFLDLSDVEDEATGYFCLDDDPRYRQHCLPGADQPPRRRLGDFFPVSNQVIKILTGKRRASLVPQTGFPYSGYMRGGWTIRDFDAGYEYLPLGVEGGIERSLKHMQALADLLRERGIQLTVVVYPWPIQLAENDRESRHVAIWREFCARNCRAFVDLFAPFFAEKDAHSNWYERLFIDGDVHFNQEGNRLIFRELAKYLL